MEQQGTSTPGGADAADPTPGKSAADRRAKPSSGDLDRQAEIAPPIPPVPLEAEEKPVTPRADGRP